jgi:uncharacterized membrane protein YeaQ/YmgE (transglycosylase-associated protein family)
LIHIPTAPAVHYLFDALAWASSLAMGVALYRWRLSETATRIAQATGSGYFAALAAGAGLGAWAAGSLNTLRSVTPTLSHSVAGALVGAIVAVELYKAVRGIKGSTGVVFTGPFASGVVVGRLGCFFAGLADFTYGVPTRLPWGVDLGDGIARHPVQIYESLSMLAFLLVYLQALNVRASWALRRSFWALAFWYGAQRFVWEFLKPYPKLIGPFNLFHLLSFALMLYGGIAYGRDVIAERRAAQERALPVLRPDDQPV